MVKLLLEELIKLIEDGVLYSIKETEEMLNNGNLWEEIKSHVEGTKIVFNSIEPQMTNFIKDNYKYCKDERGSKYPMYNNGLSIICCVLIEFGHLYKS